MRTETAGIILHDYWRSSAAYRVRITLNLLGLPYRSEQVVTPKGDNRSAAFLKLNPQGLLPTLVLDGQVMTQSLAIIEYLNARVPRAGLLPADPMGQYRVRQLSHVIAMEIHPVCNLSIATHVGALTGRGEVETRAWMRRYIPKGLAALERLLEDAPESPFCHGESPTMADICLVPQLYNAARWDIPYDHLTNLARIGALAAALPAFAAAHPDAVRPEGGRA
ncbi:maleylacetoacetate isomerase [Oceanibium sediminis]|uniref:maleylacetoacetate isomerase n=1 Tax=Oceanibium sediminis TaxID=2026339 RepID=UPI000DD3A8A0|nr:maleylacetoacetate isomerase [Oceanibium sediminis]